MTDQTARLVLQVSAIFTFVGGLFLLTGTWDGLWDALDLPQGQPALFVQVGGAMALGLGYLLWLGADDSSLQAPVARAAAGVDALAGLLVLLWLITGSLPEDVDGLGTAILIALVIVLWGFALLEARVATRAPGRADPRR